MTDKTLREKVDEVLRPIARPNRIEEVICNHVDALEARIADAVYSARVECKNTVRALTEKLDTYDRQSHNRDATIQTMFEGAERRFEAHKEGWEHSNQARAQSLVLHEKRLNELEAQLDLALPCWRTVEAAPDPITSTAQPWPDKEEPLSDPSQYAAEHGLPWRIEVDETHAQIINAAGQDLICYAHKGSAFKRADLVAVLQFICKCVNASEPAESAPGTQEIAKRCFDDLQERWTEIVAKHPTVPIPDDVMNRHVVEIKARIQAAIDEGVALEQSQYTNLQDEINRVVADRDRLQLKVADLKTREVTEETSRGLLKLQEIATCFAGESVTHWAAAEIKRLRERLTTKEAECRALADDINEREKGVEQAGGYAIRLLISLAPDVEPLGDTLGVLTQIDNAICARKPTPISEAELSRVADHWYDIWKTSKRAANNYTVREVLLKALRTVAKMRPTHDTGKTGFEYVYNKDEGLITVEHLPSGDSENVPAKEMVLACEPRPLLAVTEKGIEGVLHDRYQHWVPEKANQLHALVAENLMHLLRSQCVVVPSDKEILQCANQAFITLRVSPQDTEDVSTTKKFNDWAGSQVLRIRDAIDVLLTGEAGGEA